MKDFEELAPNPDLSMDTDDPARKAADTMLGAKWEKKQ